MSLYALLIYDKNYELRHTSYHLDEFPFFYRYSIQSNIEEFAGLIIKKCEPNKYYEYTKSVGDKQMTIYGSTYDNYIILITSADYPRHIVLRLSNILIKSNPPNTDELFNSYKNPVSVDKIEQIKNELDLSKEILRDSMEKIIARGESLEDLLIRAGALEDASNELVIGTEKLNRCCIIF